MAYKRKTRDVFEIQGDYGNGYEYICEEETLREAKKTLAEYDENELQYPHRIRRKRERIANVG